MGRRPDRLQSADDKPVQLIVLIVSPPDDTTNHVQALGAISRKLGHASVRQAAMNSRLVRSPARHPLRNRLISRCP